MAARSKGSSADTAEATVDLRRLERRVIEIEIRGTAPLIVHRFSEKSKAMMLEAQQSKTRRPKEVRDPEKEFEAARYRLDDGRDGFPAAGFKAAIVGAARLFDGITLVLAKQMIVVQGIGSAQLVPIISDPPVMREDTVRLGSGTADLRYRPEYWPWSAKLHVGFLPSQITDESILALVDAAGIGGIAEWRPTAPKSLTGSFGTFEVAG